MRDKEWYYFRVKPTNIKGEKIYLPFPSRSKYKNYDFILNFLASSFTPEYDTLSIEACPKDLVTIVNRTTKEAKQITFKELSDETYSDLVRHYDKADATGPHNDLITDILDNMGIELNQDEDDDEGEIYEEERYDLRELCDVQQ